MVELIGQRQHQDGQVGYGNIQQVNVGGSPADSLTVRVRYSPLMNETTFENILCQLHWIIGFSLHSFSDFQSERTYSLLNSASVFSARSGEGGTGYGMTYTGAKKVTKGSRNIFL